MYSPYFEKQMNSQIPCIHQEFCLPWFESKVGWIWTRIRSDLQIFINKCCGYHVWPLLNGLTVKLVAKQIFNSFLYHWSHSTLKIEECILWSLKTKFWKVVVMKRPRCFCRIRSATLMDRILERSQLSEKWSSNLHTFRKNPTVYEEGLLGGFSIIFLHELLGTKVTKYLQLFDMLLL